MLSLTACLLQGHREVYDYLCLVSPVAAAIKSNRGVTAADLLQVLHMINKHMLCMLVALVMTHCMNATPRCFTDSKS